MPGIIVIGLQWGDEGKGKIIDLLSSHSSHVVRSQGGNNAGHTIKTKELEFGLHLVPSGALHDNVQCYIAGGCLIDAKVLIEEIENLESNGVSILDRLHISPYAHLILPFHRSLDLLQEEKKGAGAIGTTGRGIGPCVSDRALRMGLRVADLIRPESFKEKLDTLATFNSLDIDVEAMATEYNAYGKILWPFIKDVEGRIKQALLHDESVLFEGAHGTLLDGLFGSYPYVTSSSTLAAGVCAGAGVGPLAIDEVYGVLKAYTTRVGAGPLPTTLNRFEWEAFHESEDFREVGTTTGRERRIGWLDLVLAKYAIELNTVNNLVLTKLDVLDPLPEIKVCVGYSLDGQQIDKPPPLADDLERMEPIYETLPGWQTSTKEAETIRDLPDNARRYIDAIEEFCQVPIAMISVGPSREETIHIDEVWME